MKRILSIFLTVALLTGTLIFATSCSPQYEDDGKLTVVTTVFPLYDWSRELLKGNEEAELLFLQDSGVDLHSYSPNADDLLKIMTCDVFIYVGGASDAWVESALQNAVNPNRKVLNLLSLLGELAREEETVEGMESEEEEEGEEWDEHIWMSLRNASFLCGKIAEAIKAADPANADLYQNNLTAYQAELVALDQRYQETVDAAPVKTLLFADRFPFLYLLKDYGIDYYAAFAGCSTESNASFQTVIFLAEKLDTLGLSSVMVTENSDQRIANSVIQQTQDKNMTVRVLNALQSVSQTTAEETSYLSVMQDNRTVLEAALQK